MFTASHLVEFFFLMVEGDLDTEKQPIFVVVAIFSKVHDVHHQLIKLVKYV